MKQLLFVEILHLLHAGRETKGAGGHCGREEGSGERHPGGQRAGGGNSQPGRVGRQGWQARPVDCAAGRHAEDEEGVKETPKVHLSSTPICFANCAASRSARGAGRLAGNVKSAMPTFRSKLMSKRQFRASFVFSKQSLQCACPPGGIQALLQMWRVDAGRRARLQTQRRWRSSGPQTCTAAAQSRSGSRRPVCPSGRRISSSVAALASIPSRARPSISAGSDRVC